jgi:hypothetical protein
MCDLRSTSYERRALVPEHLRQHFGVDVDALFVLQPFPDLAHV